LQAKLDPEIEVIEVDAHINTPEFGKAVAQTLMDSVSQSGGAG
jgi:uncharacterized protein (UPF0261 family)